MDFLLQNIPERLEKANEQLTNLYNQQEAELAAKGQRLAELDAALNMEDTAESRAEKTKRNAPLFWLI